MVRISIFLFLIAFCPAITLSQKVETVVNTGHRSFIDYLKYSPDGNYIASGSTDGSVKLWDIKTGRLIRTFNGNAYSINAICFSKDGELIIAGGSDDYIHIWDVATGKEINTLHGHWFGTEYLEVTPDNKYLISAGGENISIRNFKNGSNDYLLELNGHSSLIRDAKLSNDGKLFISGSDDKTAILWSPENGDSVLSFIGHNDYIFSVDISSYNKYLATGSWDHTAKLWNPRTGELINTFNTDEVVFKVHFSPDNKYLFICNDDTLNIVGLASQQIIKTIHEKDYSFIALDFSPDGKNFISLDDDKILIWDIETLVPVKTIGPEIENIAEAQFSPDNKNLVFASGKHIKTINLRNSNIIRYFNGHTDIVNCFDFSGDGSKIISGAENDSICLWDFESMDLLKVFSDFTKGIFDVSISDDEKYVVAGCKDRYVRVWDNISNQLIYKYKEDADPDKVEFFGNETIYYSNDLDFTIKKITVPTFSEPEKIAYGQDMVNSFDINLNASKVLYSDLTSKLIQKNLITGDYTNFDDYHSPCVEAVRYSHDYNLVLSGGVDGVIKIWDANTGKLIRELKGHATTVDYIYFSNDDKYILSTSDAGISKLWETSTGKELATIVFTDEAEWAVVSPDGYFDASEGAYDKISFVKGLQIIPLESLFEEYYTPKLLSRIFAGEDISKNKVNINKLQPAPEVTINSPQNNYTSTNKTVTIEATIIDKGGGIDEYRAYHNNKLLENTQRGFKNIEQSDRKSVKTNIHLSNGKNQIKITAFNNQRTESIPAEINVFYDGEEKRADLYVLAIGINEYKNSNLNLNYAIPDAEALVKYLNYGSAQIFKDIHVHFIKNSDATKAAIISEIEKIKNAATAEDVFVFYYAGHGVMGDEIEGIKADYYLVPHDVTQLYGNEETLVEKALSSNEIMKYSTEIKAQKQLLIMDACQSGGAIETFASRGAAEQKAIMQLARSTGIMVLAASGSEQFATEFNELGHGAFTYALLEGLKCQADGGKKDFKVTVSELKAFLEDRLPELTEKYKGKAQYPTGYSRGQDFPIVICK